MCIDAWNASPLVAAKLRNLQLQLVHMTGFLISSKVQLNFKSKWFLHLLR